MEQVEFVALKDEWEDLDDILSASLSSSESYNFECHGPTPCLVQFGTSKPTDMGGILLDKDGQKILSYTVGSDNIYVRGVGGSSSLNIVQTS